MSGYPQHPPAQVISWAKAAVDAAVQTFMDRGILDTALLEAKPAWAHPPDVLLVKIREQGEKGGFFWIICGEGVPFDHVYSTAARSPRDAARHFAMKWHLEAAKLQQSASADGASAEAVDSRQARGDTLQAQAEALFRLVNDDSLWG